ncbi:MAG: hypothetical protein FD180_886 [Planctomycetota bacterium]|nr:MAG: hypothetical protein FD180_886 [Planctomycetota bacterium]
MRGFVLVFPMCALAAGCAGNGTDARHEKSSAATAVDGIHAEINPVHPKIAREIQNGSVRIDWNGLRLEQLIHGVALATGRVFVFDRRRVEGKPPANLSRSCEIQLQQLYLLLETVLAGNQLACLPQTVPLSAVSSWEVLRVVPRMYSRKGANPYLEESNSISASDIPFLVVAGPDMPASAVRRALVRIHRRSGMPGTHGSSLDPSEQATDSGSVDNPLCDLFRFRSPYPQCLR